MTACGAKQTFDETESANSGSPRLLPKNHSIKVARSWIDNAPFPRDGGVNPPTSYLICRWIPSD